MLVDAQQAKRVSCDGADIEVLSRESAPPVAVRPSETAEDLKAVQGLLRSFAALAPPCARCLPVISVGGGQRRTKGRVPKSHRDSETPIYR